MEQTNHTFGHGRLCNDRFGLIHDSPFSNGIDDVTEDNDDDSVDINNKNNNVDNVEPNDNNTTNNNDDTYIDSEDESLPANDTKDLNQSLSNVVISAQQGVNQTDSLQTIPLSDPNNAMPETKNQNQELTSQPTPQLSSIPFLLSNVSNVSNVTNVTPHVAPSSQSVIQTGSGFQQFQQLYQQPQTLQTQLFQQQAQQQPQYQQQYQFHPQHTNGAHQQIQFHSFQPMFSQTQQQLFNAPFYNRYSAPFYGGGAGGFGSLVGHVVDAGVPGAHGVVGTAIGTAIGTGGFELGQLYSSPYLQMKTPSSRELDNQPFQIHVSQSLTTPETDVKAFPNQPSTPSTVSMTSKPLSPLPASTATTPQPKPASISFLSQTNKNAAPKTTASSSNTHNILSDRDLLCLHATSIAKWTNINQVHLIAIHGADMPLWLQVRYKLMMACDPYWPNCDDCEVLKIKEYTTKIAKDIVYGRSKGHNIYQTNHAHTHAHTHTHTHIDSNRSPQKYPDEKLALLIANEKATPSQIEYQVKRILKKSFLNHKRLIQNRINYTYLWDFIWNLHKNNTKKTMRLGEHKTKYPSSKETPSYEHMRSLIQVKMDQICADDENIVNEFYNMFPNKDLTYRVNSIKKPKKHLKRHDAEIQAVLTQSNSKKN